MKVLITGASGLLGRSLSQSMAALVGQEVSLVLSAFSRAAPPLVSIDLTDEDSVRSAFGAWSPDLVVHAAAERRPDAVDRDPSGAERLNVGATRALARLAAESGARFLYVSTDYVFDGSRPPYAPDATPSPINAYGRMKLAGEIAVREAFGDAAAANAGSGWAIVRIPILYGRVQFLRESPVTELAAKLDEGRPFMAEDWASRYPAHADDAARAIALVCGRLAAGECGIWHFAGAERITKYGMAISIAEALGVDRNLVEPDARPPSGAPRPRDCRLDGSRLEAIGFRPRISFSAGVRDALAPFFPGRSLGATEAPA